MKTQSSVYSLNERLHSDVLEETYGPISVQLLRDDDHTREVLLIDKTLLARTYALTFKSNSWKGSTEICTVNDAIKEGEPIGKAFRRSGFTVQKKILDVFVLALPRWLQVAFGVQDASAKARTTVFIVQKGRTLFTYGVIIEIYSPHFRKAERTEADKRQVNAALARLHPLDVIKAQLRKALQKRTDGPHNN